MVSQHALQQFSRGVSAPGGVPGPGGVLLLGGERCLLLGECLVLGGVLLLGGGRCLLLGVGVGSALGVGCGLLLWPSVVVFWFGGLLIERWPSGMVFGGGRRP